MWSPEDVGTLRAGLQQDDEAAPPAGAGEVVAVELLVAGEVIPGRARVQAHQRLVVREDELGLGARHPPRQVSLGQSEGPGHGHGGEKRVREATERSGHSGHT